jgi:uncharacterized protein YndB with AHSA1/START domain
MALPEDGGLPDRDIVSARTFDATRERVLAAFADPVRLARWWGPRGFTNTIDAYEFQPGGRWRSTMHAPDGASFPNDSVFDVVEPERIVFRHLDASHPYEMTIRLEERDGKTSVTWRMRHESAAVCAKVRPYVVAGNEENFDRLAEELARRE